MIPNPATTPPGAIPTVAWRSRSPSGLPGELVMIDQTRLPHEAVELVCADVEQVRDAIVRLAVRGAPAIGVAAAYGLVLAAQAAPRADGGALGRAAERLKSARPTAVNLAWAVDRCVAAARDAASLLVEVKRIHAEDEAACAAMGRNALPLLRAGGTYLTHCNTGRFATAGIGTAFGVFVTAQEAGLDPFVHATEVRPLLQGARLTAYELRERGIRGALIPDSAAGALLRSGRVDAVFVGADRIAANGDTANKIGTYALAELARANGVPFHVVAPTSTIDATISDGSLVPIEERAAEEVLAFRGAAAAPAGFPVWNPAFDVTPARLVSSIVTERGVDRAPYRFAERAAGPPGVSF
jgi:methylthioribose-1-phosphate isomerase